jgi:hypothetical protein
MYTGSVALQTADNDLTIGSRRDGAFVNRPAREAEVVARECADGDTGF